MNQPFSVFLLFLRTSFWRILAVLLGMAAAELLLFGLLMPDPATNSLEAALDTCGLPLTLVLLLGIVLTVIFLLTNEGKHRTSYTLDRLRVTPGAVIALQALWNCLALLLFWAVQIVTILGLFLLYQRAGGMIGPQTFYLACWQNDMVHSFLPMEEWTRWAAILVTLVSFGVILACSAAQRRKKRNAFAFYIILGLVIYNFIRPMGYPISDLTAGGLSLLIAIAAVCSAAQIGEEDEKHEQAETT